MFDHRQLAAALESVSSMPAEPIALTADGDALIDREYGVARYGDPRRQIFDAMIETVAQRGYDRTTIERVLHVAQIPAPVFDEHFEDKQDCFLHALDKLIGRLEQILLARVRWSAPWPERIQMGLRALLVELAEHPDSARVAMVECLSTGEAALARLRSALARLVAILDEGRAYAAERGSPGIEYLPPQISTAVVGGIAAIVHRQVLEDRTAELPLMLGDLLYFALLPYLGHDGALSASGLEAAAA
ncbi:MAG TPA: TetR/AcrR family transcriptional regulator [Solirubrobacteraceae bacterium]|jgi:AcrR family transcriptional regulator